MHMILMNLSRKKMFHMMLLEEGFGLENIPSLNDIDFKIF